jgi:predicted phosphodiesterase
LKLKEYCMRQIFFCGDVHGDFEFVINTVRSRSPSAIVFLGDLQAKQPLGDELQAVLDLTDVWWIHGNHDTDSDTDYDNLFESTLADRNLHGRVVEIAGYRVAGLGGVFRGQVWMPPSQPKFQSSAEYVAKCGKGNLWRGGLPRKHRSSIFPEDYLRLSDEHADILVTHEAPSAHPHGFDVIDNLAHALGVHAAFHGHHHDQRDYSAHRAQAGFVAYGVGLCGITDQDGQEIIAGRLDD